MSVEIGVNIGIDDNISDDELGNGGAASFNLLMETGDALLMETGDKLLREDAA